ncbi:MAG: hypothetical protein WCA77_04200 [Thermoplasmata archaeon]
MIGIVTVVLVAALYVAPTIIHQSTNVYALDLVGNGSFQFGNPATFVANFSLYPSPGLTTSMFGLRIGTQFGSNVSLGVVPEGCIAGASFVDNVSNPCGTPRFGWYAVIVQSGTGRNVSSVLATFGNQTFQWFPEGIALAHTDAFYVVSRPDLTGSGDVVSIYGVHGANVIGQARF